MKKYIVLVLILISVHFVTVRAYSSYKIGDEVVYNNVDYYVIKNSDEGEKNLLLLKKKPLTVAEVNEYGTGHVNMNIPSNDLYYQLAYDVTGNGKVGGLQYYSSPTCGYDGSNSVYFGCTTNYADSEIKHVVDAWALDKAPSISEARLITMDDLTSNLGMKFNRINLTIMQVVKNEDTPMWIFGDGFGYWTSTASNDNTNKVWNVLSNGYIELIVVSDYYIHYYGVRPVITLSKTVLGDIDEDDNDEDTNFDDKDESGSNEDKEIISNEIDNDIIDNDKYVDTKDNILVKVDDTYKNVLIIMVIGFLLASVGIFTVYIVVNKKRQQKK